MQGVRKGDSLRQAAFIAALFGVAISAWQKNGEALFLMFFFGFLQHSLFSFQTAWRTRQGYEAMHIMRKGQMQGVQKGDSLSQAIFIAELFGVAR